MNNTIAISFNSYHFLMEFSSILINLIYFRPIYYEYCNSNKLTRFLAHQNTKITFYNTGLYQTMYWGQTNSLGFQLGEILPTSNYLA